MKRLFFAAYLLSFFALSFLSFVFVDPNLLLINQSWFISWQQWMWSFARDTALLANVFLLITLFIVFSYAALIWFFRRNVGKRMPLIFLGLVSLVLLFGYNAYSHDVFNYLFNAKMALEYQANPHVKVALDFPNDEWLRFMHNVHTPAPYGYGWTGISLLPMILSFGKFLPAYAAMKTFVGVGLGLYLFFIWKLLGTTKQKNQHLHWLILAFNPLLLIETLLNGHNDVWMMWPALAAWYFIKQKKNPSKFVLAAALLLFSISIKFATVLLLPLIANEFFAKLRHPFLSWVRGNWAELAALLMLAPLLTDRSQQFHPWYLVWALSFLPFIHWKVIRYSLLGLSISSLFRYYPWILAGFQYNDVVQGELRFITWSGLVVALAFWAFEHLQKRIVPAMFSRRDA